MHGGGFPIMEDIAIMGSYDMELRKANAKYLAGMHKENSKIIARTKTGS